MNSRVFLLLGASISAFGAFFLEVPQHGSGQHGQQQHGAGQIGEVGEMFKAQCAGCHIPPDLRFKPDKAWLEQINQTAWTDTPKGARAALIKYFEANQTGLPAIAPSRAIQKDAGFVTPSFALGAVLVEDEAGHITRLSWEDEKVKERRRALAPGKYMVRGYRLIRTDKGGKEWIVSASGHSIKELVVEPRKESKLAIDESIQFASGMKVRSGKIDVMMMFQGEGHSGLTLYAAGKRVSVTYAIHAPAGEELASGSMTYGWGGGGWASCRPKADVKNAVLKLIFEEPPFTVRREPMKH